MSSPRSFFSWRRSAIRTVAAAILGVLLLVVSAERQAAAVNLAGAVTQNFDGIGTSATATLPADFRVDSLGSVRTVGTFTGAGTATTRVGGGSLSSTAGYGIYNFGAGTTATGPDRAIGFLASGSGTSSGNLYVRLTNNTGAALGSLGISYSVEKYRNGTNAAGFRIQMYYSSDGINWTSAGGPFSTAFAPDTGGNTGFSPAPGVTVSVSNKPLAITVPDGADFYLAWNYSVAAGNTVTNSQALAIDDIVITGTSAKLLQVTGAASPATLLAGSSTVLTATVSPATGPASTGLAVTGDLSAIGGASSQAFYDDGTHGDALAGDNVFSYQAAVTAGTTAGSKSLAITVSDAQNRTASTTIALTIDPPIYAIHDIQGSTGTSPYAGQLVAVTGIVTGVKPNGSRGFFLQAPDNDADGDPATSEGVFVYTGGTPPAAAVVGNLVKVVGTVQEYANVPPGPTLTEISSPTVTLISSGNPLPAPVTLTAADTNPAGGLDVLERFEGMRVHVNSVTVVGPTIGAVTEATASASSKGTFFAVIDGVARPFREPGLELPDPLLSGGAADYNPPRFDGNPERLLIASTTMGGAPIDVAAGATVGNLTGPLEYGSRTYTIDLDPTVTAAVTDTMHATVVPVAASGQFTVASLNMQHFYDTTNDPGGDVALQPDAFARRVAKASLVIRDVMRLPDIIGVQEVENIATLKTVAQAVNDAAVAAGFADPAYQAYLEPGNDSSDINVGFLIKHSVTAVSVTQVGKDTTFVDPRDGSIDILNDRPPLVLAAQVHDARGGPDFPLTVIVNHLRSLSGVSDADVYARTKRRLGAEFLAGLIQSHQAAGEHVVSVGDYNAYQFNDGYVDVIGTVLGAPAPPSEVLLPSADLVDPNLVDLIDLAPAPQRYSYVETGSAQVLDHVVVSADLLGRAAGLSYGRCNADFPDVYRNDSTRPERLSDHDPAVAYFTFPTADVGVATAAVRNPVSSGKSVSYTVAVSNSSVDAAVNPVVVDTLPAGTTFLDTTAPAGWTCTSAGDKVTCTAASLAADTTATITINATLDCDLPNGNTLTNRATVTADTFDPDATDNASSFDTTVVNNPPVVTLQPAAPAVLWPVNHKMVPVALDYTVTDECGAAMCVVTVTSNEKPDDRGDGNTSSDWTIVDDHHLDLRAERSGNGPGRVYTITVTCTDGAGYSTTQTTQVVVPKSQK